MMKKICLLGYMKVHGGIQRNIVNVSNYLCNSYEVYIVNLDEECEIPYSLNERVHVISLNVKNHWQEFVGLWETFSNIKPDVVIGFWLLNAIWAAIAKVNFHYKCIYSERNDPSNHEYGLLLKIARCIGFSFVDAFVFQHRKARDFFGKRILNRSFIIANAVELYDIKAKEIYRESVKKFITVGRLHGQKNQSLMIDAFANVIRENRDLNDISLDIYGDGSLADSLQKKINQYGLTDNIHIHNAQSGIYEIMKDADAFLLTSNYEGMPNVLIEAMSLGLPCVSTDYSCGGVNEIIENGRSGLVIDVNNVEQLQGAIKMLCQKPGKAKAMGQEAKKLREKHKPDYIMSKWENMIEAIMR